MDTTEMMQNAFILELKNQGFKQYMHTSGFTAWSKANLCEYSDEWQKLNR